MQKTISTVTISVLVGLAMGLLFSGHGTAVAQGPPSGHGPLFSVSHNVTLTGDGTSATPLGIANGGVGPNQLANGAVTLPKLNGGTASAGQVLTFNGSGMAWQTPGGAGDFNNHFKQMTLDFVVGGAPTTFSLPRAGVPVRIEWLASNLDAVVNGTPASPRSSIPGWGLYAVDSTTGRGLGGASQSDFVCYDQLCNENLVIQLNIDQTTGTVSIFADPEGNITSFQLASPPAKLVITMWY